MYIGTQLPQKYIFTGANPTTSIYNASVVKIYNSANSLARFKNKNYFHPM
jgi:hypothetical protein